MNRNKKPRILRHLLGLLAFPLSGFVVAILWLWLTAGLLGIGRTGFGNGAVLITMPLWGLGIGLLLWLPWWLIHNRKWGVIGTGRALLSGAVAGFVAAMLLTGPSGFTLSGGAPLINAALILIAMAGALAHNALLRRGAETTP